MPHRDPVKRSEYVAQWRAKNKDVIAQKQKERYELNKDKILARQREAYQQDKTKITERNKSYRQRNRKRINEYARQYREQNPDLVRAQARERYERQKANNIRSLILASARARAKQKGIDFDIEEADVIWNTHCPILGIKLSFRQRGKRESAASLDRVDCKYGYVKGNVQIISNRANRIKSDATVEELERIVAYMKGR